MFHGSLRSVPVCTLVQLALQDWQLFLISWPHQWQKCSWIFPPMLCCWPSLLLPGGRRAVNYYSSLIINWLFISKCQVQECVCPNKWILTLLGLNCHTKSSHRFLVSLRAGCQVSSSLDLEVYNLAQSTSLCTGHQLWLFLQQGMWARPVSSEMACTMTDPAQVISGHKETTSRNKM